MPTPPVSSTPATSAAPVVPATPQLSGNPGKLPVTDPKSVKQPEVKPDTNRTPVDDMWDVHEDGKVIKKSRKEIIEAFQLRQLSDKKRSEADKSIQEYNKLFQVFKQDPIKFMRATGVDFDNLATSYLAKKAEESMMDPKERELQAAKAEAAEYKKWVEEQKTNQEKVHKDGLINAERNRIHAEIIAAIEESKELGMPVDEELVIAIAQKMMLQGKASKPLNAKEALPAAYQSTQKWLQGMASKMEGEAIVKWLGEDVARKIRKYDLGQLKSKRAQTAPQSGQSSVKPQEQKRDSKAVPYKTWSEFKRDNLDTIK